MVLFPPDLYVIIMKYYLYFSFCLSFLFITSCSNRSSSDDQSVHESSEVINYIIDDSDKLVIDYPDSIKSSRDSLIFRAKLTAEYAAKMVNKAQALVDSVQILNERFTSRCDSVSLYLNELQKIDRD